MNKSQTAGAKIAVICSQFPEMHETFVIRELRALKEGGIPIVIYSMKFCRDKIVHADWLALKENTVYLAWDDAGTWKLFLSSFRARPRVSLDLLGWAVKSHLDSPVNLAKALIVWGQAVAMASRMKQDGVTHIHAHWATLPTSAALIAARLLGLKFSFTAHAWDIFVKNPSLAEKVRTAEAVITCTEFNMRHLENTCPDSKGKIHLNYHGVNMERFSSESLAAAGGASLAGSPGSADGPKPWKIGEPVRLFLSVGRFVEQKGYEDLITAYESLVKRGRQFRAVIVGEGPLREKIMKQARNAGLLERIAFRESMGQEELKRFYRDAFAFVLPCVVSANGDRDGIPNVILEAMAAGLPVISTTVSGVPEAVKEQRTGLCVPPHDPQGLTEALDMLLRNEDFAEDLGTRARQYARETFDAKIHMAKLASVMRRIAGISEPVGDKKYTLSPGGRIKAAQLIWSLEMGGAERVAAGIALGMDRNRFDPIIICLNHEGVLAPELVKKGIPVYALNKKAGLDLGMLGRLTALLQKEKVEILHAHLFGAGFWARLAGRRAGVKKVIVHEHGMQPWRKNVHFLIDRALASRTDRILFVSQKVLDGYLEKTHIPKEKCVLVPNGVPIYSVNAEERKNLRERLNWKISEKWIVSVGRLSPEKGHADLVQAFAEVSARVPEARLALIGGGPEETHLRNLTRKFGLENKVFFAGLQKDVSGWLSAADLYVQPSRREGLSLAILEAMGAGIPVISTRTGDVEKVINEGVTGFLCEPEHPDSLAAKIIQVLSILDDLSGLRRDAKKIIISRYSQDHMVRAIEMLYSSGRTASRPDKSSSLLIASAASRSAERT